ncbi:MAG: hypothetical protein C0478_01400 [Planctomyces sp.]|nr:hypothetical protein [Planctomyces sp.]
MAMLWSTAILADDEQHRNIIRSTQSGAWSDPATWDAGRTPAAGDSVLVRGGHRIVYDIESGKPFRVVQVAGTLDFARDRNTRMDVGLLKVTPDEVVCEEGFDCHLELPTPAAGTKEATLLVGAPGAPIPQPFHAIIRLHHLEGMDKTSCPAVVVCGGRMEFHGAPLKNTWVKLQRTADAGSRGVVVDDAVDDWREGDQVIITATKRLGGMFRGSTTEERETELRTLVKGRGPFSARGGALGLNEPLKFQHFAERQYRGEIANLSRNVVVESAEPEGVRGHTMYHQHSTGSISYAEFRHLGKRDMLGRYSLHFHLAGDSMRGSSVIGASIWDSHNRWLAIHGTQYLVIRDCVGYRSVGHGFFLEDGTEVYNVLDHNLAVEATAGKPLPQQAIPFDNNRGAGFWWANCLNTFTRNTAVDCDEYGYRFEARETVDFNPRRPILQPDGQTLEQDIRTLPFVLFSGNEAHAMRFFGLNLRGMSRPAQGLDFYALNTDLQNDARSAHPDQRYPFWIHNFLAWETNWSFHAGTSGVFLDGFDCYRSEYGIWRSVMDRHTYLRTSYSEMSNKDLHMPFSLGLPDEGHESSATYFRGIPRFTDDRPPATIITQCVREGGLLRIQGTSIDSGRIRGVWVNGVPARPRGGSFAEWEVVIESGSNPDSVTAYAEDHGGRRETTPHVLRLKSFPSEVAATSSLTRQVVESGPASR